MADPETSWTLVQNAILAFGAKVPDLKKARAALAEVLQAQAWQSYVPPLGKPCSYKREEFEAWVTADVPRGLGTTIANLVEIARGEEPLAGAVEALTGRKARSDKIIANVDNVNVSDDLERPTGNNRRAALRRLRKDAPGLHAEVIAGRLSAHAAMVQAGFRPRTVTIPVTRPEAVAQALLRHMTADDLAIVVKLLLMAGELCHG